MSRFESRDFELSAEADRVKDFLEVPENLYEILPQDRIEDWKADKTHCSFKIKGLSSLDLHIKENGDPKQVEYRSGEKAPFPFTLFVQLEEGAEGTTCRVLCEAEMNAFLEQMARKPFEKLFEHMGTRLSELNL